MYDVVGAGGVEPAPLCYRPYAGTTEVLPLN